MNLPNKLSILRVALIVLLILAIPMAVVAGIIFLQDHGSPIFSPSLP